jgi:hypothetical protein
MFNRSRVDQASRSSHVNHQNVASEHAQLDAVGLRVARRFPQDLLSSGRATASLARRALAVSRLHSRISWVTYARHSAQRKPFEINHLIFDEGMASEFQWRGFSP